MAYDEAYNKIFHQKIEPIQYNACLALLGAIRGSSKKNYHELGSESLQHRHWYRKLCLFYKIFREDKHNYLFNITPTKNWIITPEIHIKFHIKHNFFKFFFFFSFFHSMLLNGTS